jgi:hypothetical protein
MSSAFFIRFLYRPSVICISFFMACGGTGRHARQSVTPKNKWIGCPPWSKRPGKSHPRRIVRTKKVDRLPHRPPRPGPGIISVLLTQGCFCSQQRTFMAATKALTQSASSGTSNGKCSDQPSLRLEKCAQGSACLACCVPEQRRNTSRVARLLADTPPAVCAGFGSPVSTSMSMSC